MSDQLATNTTQPGQEAQPSQVAEPVKVQPEQTQPQYVTVEQLQAAVKQAEDNAFRRAQSLQDKANARIRERLQSFEESWKETEAAGQPVPEQVKEKVRQQVRQQELANSVVDNSQGAGQAQPELSEFQQMIYGRAQKIVADNGLSGNEPELRTINEQDPFEFLAKLEATARQLRGSPQQQTQSQGGNAAHAMISGAPPNDISTIVDPMTLISMGLNRR